MKPFPRLVENGTEIDGSPAPPNGTVAASVPSDSVTEDFGSSQDSLPYRRDNSGNAVESFSSSFPTPQEYISLCFSANATVELIDGSVKPLSAVRIGDHVKVADGAFSEVFMFTHKMSRTSSDFVILKTSSDTELHLTSGHHVYINGVLAAAGAVRVGDAFESASGAPLIVKSIGSTKMDSLYKPQTLHGDIVVNGVRASTFTSAVNPGVAHALLAPFRAVYEKFRFRAAFFHQGSDFLVHHIPSGTFLKEQK